LKILIPGGAGYIGAWLVPHLLADGHNVTVLDSMWFGSGHLPDNANLTIFKGDVRNTDDLEIAAEDCDAVIYLASISSDAMCQRDPALAHAVNEAAFLPAVRVCRDAGVKRFIYASSVAAYGMTDFDATEDTPLRPTTLYANAKAACERILLEHQSPEFTTVITRSASVCGYSPHQRFDLTVNMMVHDAIRRGVITVNGGAQKRCHIHLQDICDFYMLLLEAASNLIAGQAFNVVAENVSVVRTAMRVAKALGGNVQIDVKPRTDDRSYTVDGTKAADVLGFVPRRSVEDAVRDLKVKFDSGYWPDSATNPTYQNLADGLI